MLLAEYAACARAAGLGGDEAPLIGGGSDANTVAAAGVPAIDGLGPRGKGFHTVDEFIERDDAGSQGRRARPLPRQPRTRLKKPNRIDEYLAGVDADKRKALAALRKTIRAIVPKAEECISYGIPAFRLDGSVIAGFAATGDGCSYYPFSGTTLRTLADELAAFDRTKSALHFTPGRPLPATLVRKLLRARLAERQR